MTAVTDIKTYTPRPVSSIDPAEARYLLLELRALAQNLAVRVEALKALETRLVNGGL